MQHALKEQGILKQEIYDKLVNLDSRSEVRDELEKLNEAGVVPNLELKAIDAAAVALAQESNIPIIVFDFSSKGLVKQIVQGDKVGTLIGSSLQPQKG